MKIILIIAVLFNLTFYGQNEHYTKAYSDIKHMLEQEDSLSFKKAVFISENAFFENKLIYKEYALSVLALAIVTNDWLKANKIQGYLYKDSANFTKNAAIFKVLTDTIYLMKNVPITKGFSYDFEDFFGALDWRKQFVTKLLSTHTGNCHSMPYLYKILADEIGAKASLALAPNHIYVKNRSENPEIGFYNTELTSKCFPIDAWLMASSGITTETIISGIWMEALTDKQSIALCLVDLAEGHKNKDLDYSNDFIIKCCDLALKYYPNYANGLLLKGDALRETYKANPTPEILEQMNQVYTQLFDYGYRDVPKGTYLEWLEELAKNLDQYNNKKLKLDTK